MVEAFVGLVGGGKSYNSVRRMCNYIGNGGRVVTNILFTGYNIETKEFDANAPIFPYLVNHYQWQYQPGNINTFHSMKCVPCRGGSIVCRVVRIEITELFFA